MLNNLKLGVRLGIGFAITLALLLAIAITSYTRLGALNAEIDNMVSDKFPKTVLSNDVIDAINTIARQLRNAYIMSGSERTKALESIPEQRKIISERLDKLDKTITSEKGRELFKKILASRAEYVTQQDKAIDLIKADAKQAEFAALLTGDPELTLGLPPAMTAATGMDALIHNLESYLSPAYHPLCDGIALEGMRIAARALPVAVQQPNNVQARADMMMASMMGAVAFQKDLGAVHACAHALGAVCDLHHGLANALMLDHVMAWNLEAVPEKFAELAHVSGVSGGASAFVPWLRTLKNEVGIQGGLSSHGVMPGQLPRLVELATKDICAQTNPRPCSAADFERLFRAAL